MSGRNLNGLAGFQNRTLTGLSNIVSAESEITDIKTKYDYSSTVSNGNLLIGNSSGNYESNRLTAGSNITITNTSANISIASTDTDTNYFNISGSNIFPINTTDNLLVGSSTNTNNRKLLITGTAEITSTLILGDKINNLTLPNATDTICVLDASQTLTNKKIDKVLNSNNRVIYEYNSSFNKLFLGNFTGDTIEMFFPFLVAPKIIDAGSNHFYNIVPSDIGSNLDITLPLLTSNDTFTFLNATQTLTFKTLTSPVINTSISGTAILDEDDLSSNSNTKLATQQSIKAYVDTLKTKYDFSTSVSNGKLLIGNSSGNYSVNNLTAGSNITITNSSGNISIASTDTNTNYFNISGSNIFPINTTDNLLIGSSTNSGTAKLYVSGTAEITGKLTLLSTLNDLTIPVGLDTIAVINGSQTLTFKTLTSPVINTSISGTAILDEDDMASNSNTKVATQQSIKAYVDTLKTKYDFSTSVSNGKLLIGNSSGNYSVANLTAGTNISITNSSGGITITNTATTITNNNQITNGAGYITATSTDTLENKSLTHPKTDGIRTLAGNNLLNLNALFGLSLGNTIDDTTIFSLQNLQNTSNRDIFGYTGTTLTFNNNSDSLVMNGSGISGNLVLDEDAMSSNSNTKLATQQSIKAYVDTLKTKYDFTTSVSNGKLLIGNGSGNYSVNNLTAGINISIINSSGGITINNILTNNNQLTNGVGYITATSNDTLENKTLTFPKMDNIRSVSNATIMSYSSNTITLGTGTTEQVYIQYLKGLSQVFTVGNRNFMANTTTNQIEMCNTADKVIIFGLEHFLKNPSNIVNFASQLNSSSSKHNITIGTGAENNTVGTTGNICALTIRNSSGAHYADSRIRIDSVNGSAPVLELVNSYYSKASYIYITVSNGELVLESQADVKIRPAFYDLVRYTTALDQLFLQDADIYGVNTNNNSSGTKNPMGDIYCQDIYSEDIYADTVYGNSKPFKIQHPLDAKKTLYHNAIEAPQANNMYSGKVFLVKGKAIVDMDNNSSYKMTTGTFLALNKDFKVFVSNNNNFDKVIGKLNNSQLIITSQNSRSNVEVEWLVVGVRQDATIKLLKITDEEGNFITEKDIITRLPQPQVGNINSEANINNTRWKKVAGQLDIKLNKFLTIKTFIESILLYPKYKKWNYIK